VAWRLAHEARRQRSDILKKRLAAAMQGEAPMPREEGYRIFFPRHPSPRSGSDAVSACPTVTTRDLCKISLGRASSSPNALEVHADVRVAGLGVVEEVNAEQLDLAAVDQAKQRLVRRRRASPSAPPAASWVDIPP
jgi:hypothetical protein